MSPATSGYWTRRVSRNVGILAVALGVHLLVAEATSDARQVMYRLSMATGYASVVLIASHPTRIRTTVTLEVEPPPARRLDASRL